MQLAEPPTKLHVLMRHYDAEAKNLRESSSVKHNTSHGTSDLGGLVEAQRCGSSG